MSRWQYWWSVFSCWLISVIPPGADSDTIDPDMLGKVPGTKKPNGKWVGTTGKLDTRRMTEAEAKQAHRDGAVTGIMGCAFPCIDVDSELRAVVLDVISLVETILGPAPIRSREGSEHVAMMYRGSDLRSWRFEFFPPGYKEGDKCKPHAVEFLARGRYWNVAGPHKSGKEMRWTEPDPVQLGIDGLSKVTEEGSAMVRDALPALLERHGCVLRRAVVINFPGHRQRIGDPRMMAASPELVLQLLKAVPCTAERFKSRNDIVAWLCAVKASLGPAHERYRTDVLAWFLEHPDAKDVEYFDKIWDSITDSSVGWSWLDKVSGTGLTVETDFVDHPEAVALSPIERMIADFIFVISQMIWMNVHTGERYDAAQFDALSKNFGVSASGKSGIKAAHNIFLNHDAARKVYGLTYQPGAGLIVDNCVNTWTPSKLVPVMDGDATPWLNHMRELLPDEEQFNHVLDWFAAVLRGIKVNHALVLGTLDQGMGKDTALKPLIAGIGARNCVHIEPETLLSSFTDYLMHQLIIIPEMKNFSKNEVYSKCKAMITTPPDSVRVNMKFKQPFEIKKVQNWIYTTNAGDAISLDPDDRRHYICNCEGHSPKDKRYYWELHNWLNRGGNEIVVGYLLARDISNFDRFDAPWTEAKQDMIEHATPPVVRLLNQLFAWPFAARDFMGPNELGDVVSESWVHSKSRLSVFITEALHRHGFRKIPGTHRVDGKTQNMWTKLPHPEHLAKGEISINARVQADRKKAAQIYTERMAHVQQCQELIDKGDMEAAIRLDREHAKKLQEDHQRKGTIENLPNREEPDKR